MSNRDRIPRTLTDAFGPYAELDIEKRHWSDRALVFWPVVGVTAVVLYVGLYIVMALG
jgi:hypothetical protein